MQLSVESMPLCPQNTFVFSFKRGRKMMPQYWMAGVYERHGFGRKGELARYLKWEYGELTVQGFLT